MQAQNIRIALLLCELSDNIITVLGAAFAYINCVQLPSFLNVCVYSLQKYFKCFHK